MEKDPERVAERLEGEALVRAALASEKLIAATEEAYRRAERGEPALFFRRKDFLRHQI